MRIPFWDRFDKLMEGRKEYLLADTVGIATSTLSTWKSKHRFPGADDAVRIAQALDTTVEYLVTGIEPPAAGQAGSKAQEYSQVIEDLKILDSSVRAGLIAAIHGMAEEVRREKNRQDGSAAG